MNLTPSLTSATGAGRWRVPFALLVVLATALYAAPVFAQLKAVGPTITLVNSSPLPLIGNDIAFDPDDDIYLGVIAQGDVWGAFSNAAGELLSSFRIGGANRNYPFGAFPRVAYSPELNGGQGGFLVTWHQPEPGSFANVIHSGVATYPTGITSPIRVISTNVPGLPLQGGSFANSGATIAYSPTSHRFLVAWTTALKGIQGRFVSAITGEPIGGVMQLVDAGQNGGGHQGPELAWNPATDEFGLSYAGWGGSGAFVGFKRVRASDGLLSAPTSFAFSLGTFCPDIDVNPATGNYLIGWSRGAGALGVVFDQNGVMLTAPGGFLVSGRVGTPVSFSLALNPVSGTVLAVSEDNASFEVAGVELNGSGIPIGLAAAVTSGSTASWVPRVTARPDAKQWNVSSSRHKVTLANQIVSSGSVDTPPPTSTPTSVPRMAIDVPRSNATLNGTVVVAGWALDFGGSSGTGVDAIDVYVAPVGGTSTLLGHATYGTSRPDVGSAFGSARFNTSGFVFSGALAPGTYDLTVKARSVLTGTFNNTATVRVTVAGPQSVPRMWVDTPTQIQRVKTAFTVAGWALDLGAPSGTGVNAVHVWAYPVSPTTGLLGTPRAVGVTVATIGQSRPDVGAAFGSSRFSTSGFRLNGALEPGVYNLVVFAKSSVTETFNNVAVVRIIVEP